MDYVDIVDEQGRIIGKAGRDEAHEKHLLHQSVHVMIINSSNQVLIHLRKATKKQYPLHWACSIGGHVDHGYTPEQAVAKELQEEAGVRLDLSFLGRFIVRDDVEHEIAYVYLGRSDGPFTFEEREMERAEFFDLATLKGEMAHMRMTPHLRKALELLFEHENM